MSLNKPNNYSIVDVDKSCIKSSSNIAIDPPSLINSRRYSIKKISEMKKGHSNQNNTVYGDSRQFRQHRDHPPAECASKIRYKSYDYPPTRRPIMDQYKNNLYNSRDAYNDFSESGGETRDNSHDGGQKFRKSYSYGCGKSFSSNDELDNSRNFDGEMNASSDSSRRYPYGSGKHIDHHNEYHRGSRHTDFDTRKYGSDSWNYDNVNNFEEPKRYSRYSPSNNKFSHSPSSLKNKHGIRGISYPSYINNNRSDISPRKYHNQLSSDFHCSRYTDINNDNYSSHRKEVPNRNLLSLKSTYRKNENIPHSGTRLENNRKQLDKYCTGRSRETRFNESNNCDNMRRYNSTGVNRSDKNFRSRLPPSPKYSSIRKKYSDSRFPIDDKYNNKESFGNSRRPRLFSNDQISDNESCYFDNCHNTNNDFVTRNIKGIKGNQKELCPSISDEPSSSSIVVSQEKPTESIPLSMSSPKLNCTVKPNNSFNRSKDFENHLSIPPTQTLKTVHNNESFARYGHSQKPSRRRGNNKHH